MAPFLFIIIGIILAPNGIKTKKTFGVLKVFSNFAPQIELLSEYNGHKRTYCE